jgi:hypothetical protein
MARPVQLSRENLLSMLMLRGPISATDLAASLGVNRTTIVRAIEELGPRVCVFGATRSTRYVVRRPVRNVGDRWPIYRINETGHAQAWAEVESLHDRRWRILWASAPPAWAQHFSKREGLWQVYPFFLGDIRPQGFLGRALAGRISTALQVPANPQTWSDDDTMIYLQAAGEDLPGSLVVGDDCLRRALQQALTPFPETLIAESERAERYAALAEQTARALPDSSAGGEQPKFLTTVTRESGALAPVLVKYSPPLDQPTGRRWADLLLGEWLAHEILAGQGLALPGAQIIDAAGRRFLEVPRFDRTAMGGRRGVVSLESLHNAAIGSGPRNWPFEVNELIQEGLVDPSALATTRRLHAFGELIGNTDMHPGNLAFWMDDALPFRLAPSYDMLPMLWSPGPQGEIVKRTFAPAPPLPSALEAWQEAAVWAITFWQRLAADPRLSPAFAVTAETALSTVQRLRSRLG